MKRKVILPLLIIFFLILRFFFEDDIRSVFGMDLSQMKGRWILLYQAAWYIMPVILTLIFFYPPRQFARELGISGSPVKALVTGILLTLPMMVVYALTGTRPDATTALNVFVFALFAGFFEELYFRGFVFGQLYKHAGWGFIPATLLTSVFFGLGHLSQSNDLGGSLIVFGVTFAASAWFCWILTENHGDLWLPVFLHFFMNLSWGLFSVGENASGSLWSNFPRLITIAITILYILIFVRKKERLQVTRKVLWIHGEKSSKDE